MYDFKLHAPVNLRLLLHTVVLSGGAENPAGFGTRDEAGYGNGGRPGGGVRR